VFTSKRWMQKDLSKHIEGIEAVSRAVRSEGTSFSFLFPDCGSR